MMNGWQLLNFIFKWKKMSAISDKYTYAKIAAAGVRILPDAITVTIMVYNAGINMNHVDKILGWILVHFMNKYEEIHTDFRNFYRNVS